MMVQNCASVLSEFLTNLISKYRLKAKKLLKIPLFNAMNVPRSLAQIFPKQDRQVCIM